MNSLKLAFHLFKNNIKLYFFYLLVLIISIAFYYNFVGIRYNAQILKVSNVIFYARIASVMCSIVLMTSLIFFIWHSNKFFLKHRQKETGLYLLMGISSSKIGKVFAIESLLLGLLALIIGLPIGVLTSKAFFTLLADTLLLNGNLNFSIPIRAVIETCIFFIAILIFFLIVNYFTIKNSRLIDLFNATRKEESFSKNNWVKGILGVLIIVFSYIVTLNLWTWKIDIVSVVPLITIAISVGTYIFFKSSLSIMLKLLIKNKSIIYKGTRLISFSNTLFRLSTNSRSLANTAILAAAMLTSLAFSLSLYMYVESNFLVEVPYSISYISAEKSIKPEVLDTISKSKHKILYQNSTQFLVIKDKTNESLSYDKVVMRYSEFKKSVKLHRLKNSSELLKKAEPQDNKIAVVLPAKFMGSTVSEIGFDIQIGNSVYIINEEMRVPLLGNDIQVNDKEVFILSDEAYESLLNMGTEYFFHGITIDNPAKSSQLVLALNEASPDMVNLSSYAASYNSKYYVVGVFYFLGLVMSIVFMFAMFSMIYFKILFDGLADREQYTKLIKIGMSKKEVKRSVATQVGLSFLLPMTIGILHSIIAIKPVESMLHSDFFTATCMSVLVFMVVMAGFYTFIVNKYYTTVYTVK